MAIYKEIRNWGVKGLDKFNYRSLIDRSSQVLRNWARANLDHAENFYLDIITFVTSDDVQAVLVKLKQHPRADVDLIETVEHMIKYMEYLERRKEEFKIVRIIPEGEKRANPMRSLVPQRPKP